MECMGGGGGGMLLSVYMQIFEHSPCNIHISDCPMIAMAEAAATPKGLGLSTSLVTRFSVSG